MWAALAAALSSFGVRSRVRLCLTLIGAGLLPAALLAQAGTGVITGRVYNPATQEYVRNAEVRVDGTSLITGTTDGGYYRLANVPEGAVTVTVNYTGYASKSETVNVTAGQTATRDFEILSTQLRSADGDTIALEAYVVSSEREGNSKAIMSQKKNMNITTSVASDIFGDVTDGNVGEFLKFLPGVDLDYVESETRGPRLSGMDAQYVGVSFDGVKLASADANRTGDLGRATSFEAFSISSIESIEINLTSSPDQDADAPAGNIDLKTKRAFDRKGRRVGYNFSLNLNSEEFHLGKTYGPGGNKEYKARPNYSFEYSDVFLNKRLGIVASINHVDSYTEQYRHNLARFLRVVRAIPLVETPPPAGPYRKKLEEDLLDPAKTVSAALRLEALGTDSVAVLKKGLQCEHALVRFTSAEALAYLGSASCGEELTRLAMAEPMLRAYCLTALASLDEAVCHIKLRELFEAESPELRYGAFRALRTLDDRDDSVQGEFLNEAFWLHQTAPQASPIVHLSTSKRPEIVIFGDEACLQPPFSFRVDPEFTVTAADGDERCTISRFSVKYGVKRRQCSLKLPDVLRNLAELGGVYPDAIEMVRQAERHKCLTCPVAVDALPAATTVQQLARAGKGQAETGGSPEILNARSEFGATPNLFSRATGKPVRPVFE